MFDFFHVVWARFIVIVNLEQNFAKLYALDKYSAGALMFTKDYMYFGLTDMNTRSSAIIYKSDFMLNFNSSWEFITEILPNQTSFP